MLKTYPKEIIKQKFINEYKIRQARNNFWEYRKLINPPHRIKYGWWQRGLADDLQQFVFDVESNLAPILIIEAPPQHGKSVQIIDLLSWFMGRNPHLQQIFTSFSDRLSIRANLRIQRILSTDKYQEIFPSIKLPTAKSKDSTYTLNRSLIEFVDQEGSFRNTTVEGSVTGESLDLGIIDDPLKGRKAANSLTIRNGVWDWFCDDFFTRFSENAGLLFILTRWHIDDLVGRLKEKQTGGAAILEDTNIKLLKYKAIAVEDEEHRKKGEALFPEHKSLKFLLKRKGLLGIESFEALYQQNPIVPGGNIFKRKDMVFINAPRVSGYNQIVMSVDTAYKPQDHNDATAIGVWGAHDLGNDLLYVFRKQMLYPEMKAKALEIADEYANKAELYARHKLFTILIEDKSSGQALIPEIRQDRNYNVHAIEPVGDKLTRAHVCLPQFEARRVFIVIAPWTQPYVTELISFRGAKDDVADRVDMTSQYLTYIATAKSGNITEDIESGESDYIDDYDNEYNLAH